LSDIAENKEVYLKKPTYEKDLLKWKDMDNNNLAISLKKALDIISSVEESKWTLENLKINS